MNYSTVSLALASCLLAGFSNSSHALSDMLTDPEDGMLDASRYLSEAPLGFLPIPTIITEPAVGTGLGMVAMFFHESDAQKKQKGKQSILPENISLIGAAATDNGTKAAGLGHLGFWHGDTLRYRGFLAYSSVNMDFYSLGGVDLPQPLGLNIEGESLINSLSWRLGKSRWFAGVSQTYRSLETTVDQLADLELLPTPGANEALDNFLAKRINSSDTTSGVGITLEYDSRNNPFNPETGYNYSLKAITFDDAIGSDIDYQSYNLTGLNYWNLNEKFDLGLRVQYDGVKAASDEILPAFIPPSVDLRGIPMSRYQGNHVLVGELELTWKLNTRWQVKGFTGTGRASNDFDDLSDAEAADSYGVGFRYLIARRYGFHMGADIAQGPEDTAFYIQGGSTW